MFYLTLIYFANLLSFLCIQFKIFSTFSQIACKAPLTRPCFGVCPEQLKINVVLPQVIFSIASKMNSTVRKKYAQKYEKGVRRAIYF